MLLSACGPSKQQLAQQQRLATFSTAEAALKEKMFDPDSSEFRHLRIVNQVAKAGSASTVVCGEVNSKNRQGGYEGYVSFFYVVALKSGQFQHRSGAVDFKAGDYEMIDDLSKLTPTDSASLHAKWKWFENAADFADFCTEDHVVRTDQDLVQTGDGNSIVQTIMAMPPPNSSAFSG